MIVDHLDVYGLAERLHRQFLDVVQLEIEQLGYRDLNGVRAMIIYNVGDLEMTVSELMWRGCYLGSNVSYNLKKLTETGYINQVRSLHDKRVIMIKNSDKAKEVCQALRRLNDRHQIGLNRSNLSADDIAGCAKTLRGLQQYWSRALEPIRSSADTALAA